MKIKLTHKTVLRLVSEMYYDFSYHPRTDIVSLTDNVLFRTFNKIVWLTGNTQPITLDDFYDTMDGYKDLQRAYQTLAYHHHLLNTGTIPLDAFQGVCEEHSIYKVK